MKAIEELKTKANINWVNYLTKTKEKNYNLEHIKSMKHISTKSVYNYVIRTFEILEQEVTNKTVYNYVSETLKWAEVAKTGTKIDRKKWKENGFDLYAHNIGSAQIYCIDNKNYDEVVRVLIKTHGLIGQYIRGEVNINENIELYKLIENKYIDSKTLKEVLIVLNKCIVGAVSKELYEKIQNKINEIINRIVNNELNEPINIKKRMQSLTKNIDEKEYILLENEKIKEKLTKLFSHLQLWYYESALNDFSLLEQVKILLIITNYINETTKNVTFEKIMKTIYIDYNNTKTINIYEKRIIEKYLEEITIEDIISQNIKPNPHIKYKIIKKQNTLVFNFKFSIQAKKLIEFCEVAYTTNSLYNKAVYMLYDLFGFRRDEYDRFYNEIDYLNTMNSSMNNKKVLLNYITGKNILDVGPGGGALMDLIEESNSDYNVYGIDISNNVIDELNKKKIKEKRRWNIIKGDALNLEKYFKENSIDTIIYSSIIHELYSYIEYKNKKFNEETIIKTLKSAYEIIPNKGRIIIRDGIKTEPKEQFRIIEFNNIEDIKILDNYCKDFKGREITYQKINTNTVKMLVNDAMEFLYTYTWGENSYSLEVKEQFGYFTPTEYLNTIKNNLKNAKIVLCEHFLQPGYEENLLNKITIYDEEMQITKLPDSTCIIVIEKE